METNHSAETESSRKGHKIQRRQVQRIVELRLPGDGQGPGK